jgi:hypothetical protein
VRSIRHERIVLDLDVPALHRPNSRGRAAPSPVGEGEPRRLVKGRERTFVRDRRRCGS